MIASLPVLLGLGALSFASPLQHVQVRAVTEINQAAFDEAHPVDTTATKAFSSTAIKTSDGQCLFVDLLSGDFRANLNPVQIAPCDGSTGQQWDVITAGKHNNQAGTMLVVNKVTEGCLDFNPKRTGKEVTTFSCGGRADGSGEVSDSQLFAFAGGAGPLALNNKGTCLDVAGNVLGFAGSCNAGDATQSFTFGGAAAAPAVSESASATATVATSSAAVSSESSIATDAASSTAELATTSAIVAAPTDTSPPASSICVITTMVTITRPPLTSSEAAASSSQVEAVAVTTSSAAEATTTAMYMM